ncbi:Hsp20 family protein [Steroidobacter cummioxidans]|uniref:Hsp20 family protein n=1 Tax=Steroidobacter cummioxidans TaxID=1803913 RepID=UPI000E31844E
MRTAFDFSPLFRSTVGFDRIFDLLDNAQRVSTIDNWPPYDIVKTGEDQYRVTLAVAGFGENELNVTQERNLLLVSGERAANDETQYLHRGIAGRSFQRRFELADHVRVAGAGLANGLLTIDLKREIPEAMKPRRIDIKGDLSLPKADAPKIESGVKAA